MFYWEEIMRQSLNYKQLVLSGFISATLLGAYATNIEAAEVTTPIEPPVAQEEVVTTIEETPVVTEEMTSEEDTATNEDVSEEVTPESEATETSEVETTAVENLAVEENGVTEEETNAEVIEEVVAEDAAAKAAVTEEENVTEDAEVEQAATEEVAEESTTEYLPADNDELTVDQNAASYDAGAPFDEGGTEIVKYNPKTGYIYSVNGYETALDIIENKDAQMNLINRVYLGDFGIEASDLTSVAVHPSGDYIAISAPAVEKTDNGLVAFFDAMGEYLNDLTVGALPDMVTFSNDGQYALVANEGEPNDDYTVNPEGSVSIIQLDKAIADLTDEDVNNVAVDAAVLPEEVRPLGLTEEDYPLNYEPEYIVVDDNSEYAYVSFQEASAIGKLDIANGEWVAITNMGYKDHSVPGNGLDASDKDDAINIVNWPVLGMYHPDGIDVFDVDGESYIITANEGDSQDYDGYSEEVRVKDLAEEGLIDLKAEYYAGYTQEELDALVANGLFDKDQLGRLNVTTAHPFIDENGKHNALVAFGGRSFSIIRASDMSIIFDSGDQFEQIIAAELPGYFNHDVEGETWNDVSVDGRSDNKGAETESVVVGTVNGQQYAFVASERTGGFFIYNVSNPAEANFVDYIYDPSLTNISPEGLEFVDADQSPTGQAMLIVAHELSGTVTTFNLGSLLAPVEEETEVPTEENPEAAEDETSTEEDAETIVTPVDNDQDGHDGEDKISVPTSEAKGQTAGKGKETSSLAKADAKGESVKAATDSESVAVDQAGLPAAGYQENSLLAVLALALVGFGSFLIKPFKRN